MKSKRFLLIAVCFAGLLLAGESIRAQARSDGPPRILIDASKDGGLWWFPQTGSFDPKRQHQGKPLADYIRAHGWEVIEVPRGETITAEKLRDVDVVVRIPVFSNYTQDELMAYQESVVSGTRLLLLSDGGTNDGLAQIFGLKFEPLSRFGSVEQWIPHALTTSIKGIDAPWTSITEAPQNAVLLAWLNQGETNSRPVLGYLTYGKGYVAFVGQALLQRGANHTFAASLISSLVHFDAEQIREHPMDDRLRTAEKSFEPAPGLLQPAPDATLPQPGNGQWRFDWEDVPAATSYEIVVLGPAAISPIVRATTTSSDYVRPVSEGYVADHNLRGWSWRVRAQYRNGTRGPWSRVRRFNVSPRVSVRPN